MRFANLSQEATQRLWDTWKYLVRESLDEFNEDVFLGRAIVRENNHWERPYLVLETKNGCLYIFPMPGDEFVLRLYRNKLNKQALSSKSAMNHSDHESPIGTIHLIINLMDQRYYPLSVALREFLAEGLRRLYQKYWARLSSL